MPSLVITVRNVSSGQPVDNAEVLVTGQQHAIYPPTSNIKWQGYTNPQGTVSFSLTYLDSYDVTVDVNANGYSSATISISTSNITRNVTRTISLTPASQGAPPGQGASAFLTQLSADLGNLNASIKSGGVMVLTGLAIVAVIAIAVVIVYTEAKV